VAATESDPRRGPRLTLRLRLTLLYGAVFLAAGAGLLAVTYGLFKHSQASQTRSVPVSGIQFDLPRGGLNAFISPGAFARLKNHPAANSVLSATPGGGAGFRATTATPGATTTATPGATTTATPGATTTATFVHGPPQTQLLRAIQNSGRKLLSKQVRIVARRANVELRAQQSGDASSLLEWSAIALGVVALLSIGLAWWLAGRALRPLRTMNSRAREISAENLHERLGVDGRSDELGELATTFDALLARLERAFASQRRFVANASHELRTPITLERTLVEVALADPDASLDSLRRVCERVVASTEEQERLLDALLTLARSEAGVASGESVDLAVLVDDALLAREARLLGISVEHSLEPAAVVGDQALLERLVGNLLDNAISHNASDEPWISIFTGEQDGVPTLRIANGGRVVAPQDVETLFEPFRRGVGERLGSDAGGLGLGLSIVRAVTIAHAGELEASALPAGGLAFELRFASTAGAKPPSGGIEALAT
jgi:signal transduction histidine kinase